MTFFFFVLFFIYLFFFFNDTATTEIYTLSLHDALPIWLVSSACDDNTTVFVILLVKGCLWTHKQTSMLKQMRTGYITGYITCCKWLRTSSKKTKKIGEIGRAHVWTPVTVNNLVCRLLLEKKKKKKREKKKKKKKIIKKKKKHRSMWIPPYKQMNDITHTSNHITKTLEDNAKHWFAQNIAVH